MLQAPYQGRTCSVNGPDYNENACLAYESFQKPSLSSPGRRVAEASVGVQTVTIDKLTGIGTTCLRKQREERMQCIENIHRLRKTKMPTVSHNQPSTVGAQTPNFWQIYKRARTMCARSKPFWSTKSNTALQGTRLWYEGMRSHQSKIPKLVATYNACRKEEKIAEKGLAQPRNCSNPS